jgi:hypothetical protein
LYFRSRQANQAMALSINDSLFFSDSGCHRSGEIGRRLAIPVGSDHANVICGEFLF